MNDRNSLRTEDALQWRGWKWIMKILLITFGRPISLHDFVLLFHCIPSNNNNFYLLTKGGCESTSMTDLRKRMLQFFE